jgi:hypothetical protein
MEPTFKKAGKAQIRCRRQQAPYRQIDIWIILGKIGFEWFSAHAEGFLKAVGRKPSPGSLRCSAIHLSITRKCNFINVPI